MAASSRGWILFLALAAAATAGDLVSKQVAFAALGMPNAGCRAVLVPSWLVLETNLNEGALFGFGQGLGLGFAAISVVAIVGIFALMARRSTRADGWTVAALGLIVGGILGNLYDRVGLPGLRWHTAPRLGEPVRAVRDWIHFTVPDVTGRTPGFLLDWPIFNLADTWLVVGAGILLVLSLRRPPAEPGAAAPEA